MLLIGSIQVRSRSSVWSVTADAAAVGLPFAHLGRGGLAVRLPLACDQRSCPTQLLNGGGLEQHCITVRSGKRDKDRRTVLPSSLVEPLKGHMQGVRLVHQDDLACGWGAVVLPHALERQYRNAAREWGWQWLFPQGRRWRDLWSAPCVQPCRLRGSANQRPATPCAIRSGSATLAYGQVAPRTITAM